MNKGKRSENPFNIAKNQEFELFTWRYFRNLIFQNPWNKIPLGLQNLWNSQWSLNQSDSVTAHSSPIFQNFLLFFKKKRFLRKSSKPGHGNLVLITLIVQVELWKLSFNFDDIRTNFLQVLTYYGFSRLLCYDDARHQNRTITCN